MYLHNFKYMENLSASTIYWLKMSSHHFRFVVLFSHGPQKFIGDPLIPMWPSRAISRVCCEEDM